LAWESAADEVNSSKSICVDGSDIVVDWRVGPVLFEDGLAERLSFAESNGPKMSGSFESEAKSSDSREEVENFDFIVYHRRIHKKYATKRPISTAEITALPTDKMRK
jgi:hypothetical protein